MVPVLHQLNGIIICRRVHLCGTEAHRYLKHRNERVRFPCDALLRGDQALDDSRGTTGDIPLGRFLYKNGHLGECSIFISP